MTDQIIDSLKSNYINSMKMAVFSYFKTNNPAVDTIITTLLITFVGWLINYFNEQIQNRKHEEGVNVFSVVQRIFYRRNVIVLEGKKSSTACPYGDSRYMISSSYSSRFKALWNFIIDSIDTNESIYQIKEVIMSQTEKRYEKDSKKICNFFMVFQNNTFLIDHYIYATTNVEQEDNYTNNEKISIKTDKITIRIFSYKYSLSYLKKYIDDITENYLKTIKDSRLNQRFIYSLESVTKADEENKFSCWREVLFESSKTFDNLFFDDKQTVMDSLQFFIENKDWYFEKGIPYSLGIGLHGPPGTGKTSLIKAIANYTKRHIVILSLKIIKTKRQLENFFFENTYNEKNEPNSIGFNNKIIVIEDIDCIGDIILDRNKKKKEEENTFLKNKNEEENTIKEVIHEFKKYNENNNKITTVSLGCDEPSITLDDILNLWDGIHETPGRILIISSNHYDKLDPALIRPGRIDLTHKLDFASRATIEQIYFHLFKKSMDKQVLSNIHDFFYSPAELINFYISSKKDEQTFVDRLLLNQR